MANLDSNINDVALIFEGGGMRASYTAAVVVALLENDMHFGRVYGISAGASHTVNYVSRDAARARASFTDLVRDPAFGGVKSFFSGRGFFNAHHLYEGVAEDLAGSDEVMAFDFETFRESASDVHIEGFDWETGETVAWTKADMPTMRDMMLRVRASSTMPIFMPPTTIDGRTYMDGGMGTSWGICLDAARRDGFERFFIVRTQPRGYRKKPLGRPARAVFRAAFRAHPLVAERTIERPARYNVLCDEIERLERTGEACVFYPDEMPVDNKETSWEELCASYEMGYAQAQREVAAWEKWLKG